MEKLSGARRIPSRQQAPPHHVVPSQLLVCPAAAHPVLSASCHPANFAARPGDHGCPVAHVEGIPDPEVFSMWFDRALLPGKRPAQRRQQSPELFRCRTGDSQASCFMAMYSRQHTLFPSLLQERGLMGCLLQKRSLRYFFTPSHRQR